MISRAAYRIVAVAGVLPATVVVCLTACSAPQSPTLTAPCAVIVDGSNSSSVFKALPRLKATLPTFLQDYRCKTLALVPLNASSVGSHCAMQPVAIDPNLGADVNQPEVEAERQAYALRQAEAMLACAHAEPSLANGSDVLGALRRAVIQRPSGPGPYHVLVVSDMIATGGGLHMYEAGQYSTPGRRSSLIASLSRSGQIPDMHGMSLYITDLGQGLKNPVTSVNFDDFWAALFACNAAGDPKVAPPIRG
jgi:hypothetical protein